MRLACPLVFLRILYNGMILILRDALCFRWPGKSGGVGGENEAHKPGAGATEHSRG